MGSSKAIITAGILLVTLAVPALLFVFLHTFGENEFVIPIYYQDGVKDSHEHCTWPAGPYQVPEFALTGEDKKEITSEILTDRISIISFGPLAGSSDLVTPFRDLTRVMTAFKESPNVQLLSLSSASVSAPRPTNVLGDRWFLLSDEQETIDELASCGLVLPSADFPVLALEYSLVLVDGQKRIRGYYDSRTKEEIDRLITEIEILKLEPSYEQE